ncbi:SNF2 domain-containing protein CLASSY 3-like [Andrographis paniculata]|uniref:SNF2 domain-containing protein CLASSY 3-like n=1 Tax=Andrographis paniculata TaxID=175694 RepID=UPI0021E8CFE7|nr:SNF2 domain-containing protein CLASSY 3-like [Andrographis paniculata]
MTSMQAMQEGTRSQGPKLHELAEEDDEVHDKVPVRRRRCRATDRRATGISCTGEGRGRLFEEFNFNYAVEKMGMITCHEVVQVGDGEEEETQEHRCARGLHELTLKDDQGLYCHTRNRKSKIFTSLVQVRTENDIILSGMPFQHNFKELFNTLKIVRPTVVEATMQDRTFAEVLHSDKKSSRPAFLPEAINHAVERLKVSMSPFLHVHKGTILQKNHPGIRDCVILLKPTGMQKKLIDRLEEGRLRRTLKSEFKFNMASIHPYLIQKCALHVPTDGIDVQAVEASKQNPGNGVKTKFVMEFVYLSLRLKEKVVIFSQYIQPLELIKEYLTAIFDLHVGKEILKLEGKQDKKQRQKAINAFNNPDDDSKIMLASTRCCSEGISLVGASRVILLDVVWNASVQQQAVCRAYRIGQKRFVHTYHLMTAGTTEADKYYRQAEKKRLSELVFCSSSNEKAMSKQQKPGTNIEDWILEEIVKHKKTKHMFEKIIHQPKNADLTHSLGLRGNHAMAAKPLSAVHKDGLLLSNSVGFTDFDIYLSDIIGEQHIDSELD